MKQLRLLSRILSGGLSIIVLLGGFIIMTFRRLNTDTNQVFDIFGRELKQPPIWARIFLSEERLWAGIGWFFVDAILFGLLIFIIFRLYKFGVHDE